jgi:hypothetical protein
MSPGACLRYGEEIIRLNLQDCLLVTQRRRLARYNQSNSIRSCQNMRRYHNLIYAWFGIGMNQIWILHDDQERQRQIMF